MSSPSRRSDRFVAVPDKYDPLKAGSIDGTDTEPHDKAIWKAMNIAIYHPNKNVKGDPLATIFVGRLNPETTEQTLYQVFSKFGSIENCRLVRDIITGFSKCYAFVEYRDCRSAVKASDHIHRIEIDGREVFVDQENERSMPGWIPRRLGGGLGGKKESGQLRFGGKDRPFKRPITVKPIIIRDRAEHKSSNFNKTSFVDSPRDTSSKRIVNDRRNDRTRSRSRSRRESHRPRSKSPDRRPHTSRLEWKRHKSRSTSIEKDIEDTGGKNSDKKKKHKHKSKDKKHKRKHRSKSSDLV